MNKYLRFYLDGFQQTGRKSLVSKSDIDYDELADTLNARTPESVLEDLTALAIKESKRLLDSPKLRKAWIDANKDGVNEAGGDGTLAYAAFCRGQTDALIYESLPELISAMGGDDDDDDDDDEEEDEDEDDDDDDEAK